MEKDALDVEGAAKRLGMSVSWVYKATASGTIPYFKIGRAVRFDGAKLDAYKAARAREVL